MPPSQCMVQATHAALVAQEERAQGKIRTGFGKLVTNAAVPSASQRTLIIKGARNFLHLWFIRLELQLLGTDVANFIEPEPWEKGSGGLTAISFFGDPELVKDSHVGDLPLLCLPYWERP